MYPRQEIVIIDAQSGEIEYTLDIGELNGGRSPSHNCGPPTANGIAYDSVRDRLFVHGKYWPNRRQIVVTFPDGSKIGSGV